MYRVISFLFSILLYTNLISASENEYIQLSEGAQISLLTCGPGDELYSIYGHTALRVKDDSLKIDVTFNYGTFDFNTDFFYLKFMNGNLDYLLSVSYASNFIRNYKEENRFVVERPIKLTAEQRIKLWNKLCINMEPINRAYRYDFFFDNCATRIRDLLFDVTATDAKPFFEKECGYTFRELLHEKNPYNSWSSQGIDLLLGATCDNMASEYQAAFLPEHLDNLVSSASIGNSDALPIVVSNNSTDSLHDNSFTPNVIFSILLLFTFFSTLFIRNIQCLRIIDIFLFSVTILLSLLFHYLWFCTLHEVCSWNWNVLWASPLYIFLLRDVFRKKFTKFTRFYIYAIDASLVLFIMLSVFGVEFFSNIAYLSAASLAIRVNHILYIFLRQNKLPFKEK
ncbi:MAG: DUF4105 domain-containing protein [Marinilabiliaceae bacterium]|nr:DUF4105 domain-containing protein [Marinilabiliaceae bacterium]